MGKLVMIDSHIFIWGIKGYASIGQEHEIEKAKNFIKWLSDNGYKILIPVPQMVELMSFAPPTEQWEIRKLFDKRFFIVPFDELAANKCAELIYISLHDSDLIRYRNEQIVSKNKIKYDCMLIAIAIVRGVTKIYSVDPDMTKFSNGQIEICPLPIITMQSDLFEDKPIEN